MFKALTAEALEHIATRVTVESRARQNAATFAAEGAHSCGNRIQSANHVAAFRLDDDVSLEEPFLSLQRIDLRTSADKLAHAHLCASVCGTPPSRPGLIDETGKAT